MEHGYWQQRWDEGKIGFHEGKPNELLVAHAAFLDGHRRLLVPLAGKSHDLWWLAQRGHDVVGVEFVERAARAFFEEAGVVAAESRAEPYLALQGGGVTQWVGDVFDLPGHGPFDGWLDRAALIALDPSMRSRYVDVLADVLRPGARGLLVTLCYDQAVGPGPPWSVDDATVQALFAGRFDIDKRDERNDPTPVRAHDAERTEAVFGLTRR